MSAKRKSAILLSIFLLALFFAFSVSVRADNTVHCTLYPDGNSGFILVGSDSHSITFIRSSGRKSNLPNVHFDIKGVISNNITSYALEYTDDMIMLQECSSEKNFLMAGSSTPKSGCIAINDNSDIFLVTEDTDDLVYKITPDGQAQKAAVIGESINLLFFHIGSGKVFALTDSGITDIEENRFISCASPVLPVKLNNNTCSDANGNIYSFSEETGFVKTAEFKGFHSICCTDDAVFLLRDNTVTKTDMSGIMLGEYSLTDIIIDDILSSGNSIALVCGNDVIVLKESQFRLPQEEKSDPETTKESSEESIEEASGKSSGKTTSKREESKSVSRESSLSQSSSSQRTRESSISTQNSKSKAVYEKENSRRYPEIILESSIYTIEDNTISGIPYGTTIAMLKKNLISDGSLRFFNYKGKALNSGKLGTGAIVEVTFNGETHDYHIVVSGDVTGEGSFNTNDVRKIIKMSTGEENPDKYQLLAADVNHDGEFDICDVCMLCNEYYRNECQSGNTAFV